MTHDEARIATGSLALGALDDDEAAEVRAHLAGCEPCRQEYDEFRRLPPLLGMVPAAEVAAGPQVPSEAGGNRLLEQVADERRSKERRSFANRFAGALALAAAAAVIGFVVAEDTGSEPAPADFTLAAIDNATGVWAEVALTEVGWGTKIELRLTGVAAGESCRLVAVSADGEEIAGNWMVPPGDYTVIPGAVGSQPDEIEYFEVVSGDGEMLVRIPL